jgi:hypothetical protein
VLAAESMLEVHFKVYFVAYTKVCSTRRGLYPGVFAADPSLLHVHRVTFRIAPPYALMPGAAIHNSKQAKA